MKKCLIVSNGYFDNVSTISQREELMRRFAERGVACDEIKSNAVPVLIDGGKVFSRISNYDFCIFLDKDLAAANMLEKTGLRLFNRAEAIRLCDDKMLTYISLAGSGINMPKTISSPLMYSENEDKNFLDIVEKELGYPMVVKKVYGSMGKGVYLARDRSELEKLFFSLRMYPHIYQHFVGGGGEDIRVITVGGKAVAAMRRKNPGDFRSNIELGGRGEKVILNEKQLKTAETASKILGLDYAGVDIIGENILCEVNSNAFFKGIEGVTGIDIAAIYADYVLKNV